MNGSPTLRSIARKAFEGQRQIHFYLDQISQTLELLEPNLGEVEPMRRLAAQLDGLKERLTEHHQTEEGANLFQAILELLPSHRAEIERLMGQHARLLEILEMARLHAAGGELSEASALREDLEQFLESFRRHEREEEQLLLLVRDKEDRVFD